MANPREGLATIRDYFDHEFENTLRSHSPLLFKRPNGVSGELVLKVYYDYQSGAKFASYFIPATDAVSDLCVDLMGHPELITQVMQSHVVVFSSPTTYKTTNQGDLVFTGKIILYIDAQLSLPEARRIQAAADQNNLQLEIRDRHYAEERQKNLKPLAFISHDSRDQTSIARPLALALARLLCPVWYSEFSLKPSDRLRESIEKGLKECRKCVVILTKKFLANPGWTKTEFDSVFTRERVEKSKVIVPIWHRVTPKEVYEYSPSLADIVAVKWVNKNKADEVARIIKAQVES